MFRSSAADSIAHPETVERSGSDLLIDAARQRATALLTESLVHDVRNPLNALAINVEVLTEKLRNDEGVVPPAQEKNLRAIREQVQRVDGLMKKFAEFLAPRSFLDKKGISVSDMVQSALEVLSPEIRRKRLKTRVALEPSLECPLDGASLQFVCLQPVLRAVQRAEVGSEITVSVRSNGSDAQIEVEDTQAGPVHDVPELEPALSALAGRFGGRAEIRDGRTLVVLPLQNS